MLQKKNTLADHYAIDTEKLNAIANPNAFIWNRPEHMEPKGANTLIEVKELLSRQKNEILELLLQISNGEGVLYKTTMSVYDLGKIDVYHYMYFLLQHTNRHIAQMEKIKNEFITLKN